MWEPARVGGRSPPGLTSRYAVRPGCATMQVNAPPATREMSILVIAGHTEGRTVGTRRSARVSIEKV
jgi:hypothetical protein